MKIQIDDLNRDIDQRDAALREVNEECIMKDKQLEVLKEAKAL